MAATVSSPASQTTNVDPAKALKVSFLVRPRTHTVGHELTFVIADVEAAVASDPSFSSYGLQVLVGECSGSTESMPTFGSSAWAAVGVMGSIRWHCAGRRFRSYLQTRFPYSRMAQLTALPINFQKFHHF